MISNAKFRPVIFGNNILFYLGGSNPVRIANCTLFSNTSECSFPPITVTENLNMPASNTTSNLVFSGSFPFTNISMSINSTDTNNPIVGNYTTAGYVSTFASKTFYVPFSTVPYDVLIEAPCSNITSSYSYTLNSTLPTGFTFTSNSSNST